MSDPKCAEMLLGAAERDLLTLRNMTAGAPDESYGFHVQQAAEKSFKAWLALLGETYPLTHNIETLVNLLAGRDADVEAHRDSQEVAGINAAIDADLKDIPRLWRRGARRRRSCCPNDCDGVARGHGAA